MKLLVIILSIYSIALTALPCDDVNLNDQQFASISQGSDFDNHTDIDLCSPFCSCTCCTISISEPTTHAENVIYPEFPNKELCTHYKTSFFNNYFSKIYQPPQV